MPAFWNALIALTMLAWVRRAARLGAFASQLSLDPRDLIGSDPNELAQSETPELAGMIHFADRFRRTAPALA